MTRYEELVDLAYKNDIEVFDKFQYESDLPGTSMQSEYGKSVLINRTTNDYKIEVCTLAEEIGHLKTNSLLPVNDYINPNFKRWIKRKLEIQAKRYAITLLIPLDKLRKTFEECANIYEAAEELNVTVEFVEQAIEYYNGQGIQFA